MSSAQMPPVMLLHKLWRVFSWTGLSSELTHSWLVLWLIYVLKHLCVSLDNFMMWHGDTNQTYYTQMPVCGKSQRSNPRLPARAGAMCANQSTKAIFPGRGDTHFIRCSGTRNTDKWKNEYTQANEPYASISCVTVVASEFIKCWYSSDTCLTF